VIRRLPSRPLLGTLAAVAEDGDLLFQDISAVSGGPVDFGTPTSDTEKAAGAFVDTDGDGFDELITLTGAGFPFGYFRNVPDGSGGRMLVAAGPGSGLDTGAALERDGASICAGDVDNDGDVDLFVGCGYNPLLPTGRNMLLLNDGQGNFPVDVAESLGIADGDNTTTACTFLDFDLDGDLDLLYANASLSVYGKFGDGKSHLLRNTLRETGTLGFERDGGIHWTTELNKGAWSTVSFDYDGDGWPDILHTRDISGPTQLYRNTGIGWFLDVSAAAGSGAGDDGMSSTFGNDTPNAMGVAVADPDNDGDLDIYITDIGTNAYYRNNGDGTFTEVGARAGVRAGTVGWGCTFADFDLDGHMDLHVAAGDTYGNARPTVHPWLFRNLGGGTFENRDFEAAGLRHDDPLHREQGSAVSDFDADGDPDLLVVRAERAGASPYLYRNDSPRGANRWIAVRLRGNGTTTNGSAIGARVVVTGRTAAGARVPGAGQVQEVMSATSRGSVSSFELVFGLPPETATADLRIVWPRAGTLEERTVVLTGLAVDARHLVLEFGEEPEPPPRALDAAAESTVPGGATTVVPVPGGEGPGAPDPVVLVGGPAWASVTGNAASGWSLTLAPPVPGAPATHALVLHGGAGESLSAQDHAVHVPARPFVAEARSRLRTRRMELRGLNFPDGATEVTVDGVAPRRIVYLDEAPDEDGDRTAIRVFAGRPPRGAPVRTVVVRDPDTGLDSGPVEVAVPTRKSARER
jgi:hypothetical protein